MCRAVRVAGIPSHLLSFSFCVLEACLRLLHSHYITLHYIIQGDVQQIKNSVFKNSTISREGKLMRQMQ